MYKAALISHIFVLCHGETRALVFAQYITFGRSLLDAI